MPTTSAVVSGIQGQALDFDGIDDLIEIGDMSALDSLPFTLVAWINLDALPSVAGDKLTIMSKYAGTDTRREWWFNVNDVNDKLWYGLYSDCTTLSENFSNDNYIFSSSDIGKWHHVVLRLEADGTYTFFRNGNKEDSGAGDNGTCAGAEPVRIGGANDGASTQYEFDGKLDDVRAYSRALSDEEILRLYQLGQ
jgi:hypothetical protein